MVTLIPIQVIEGYKKLKDTALFNEQLDLMVENMPFLRQKFFVVFDLKCVFFQKYISFFSLKNIFLSFSQSSYQSVFEILKGNGNL